MNNKLFASASAGSSLSFLSSSLFQNLYSEGMTEAVNLCSSFLCSRLGLTGSSVYQVSI